MSMGDYDEGEHRRRERMNTVDTSSDDDRTVYEGTVEYDSGVGVRPRHSHPLTWKSRRY